MAPKALLVSLKVIGAGGVTTSSAVIAALAEVRDFNADGRRLVARGVNLSIGCECHPDEFAAGQSPLCRELDHLAGTGVVAVVSAGNAGAGGTVTGGSTDVHGRMCTITVGSTHRSAPHVSGAVAAFLSVRDEYIGQPDGARQLFMGNATSLGRHEFFQGAGLVDLMRWWWNGFQPLRRGDRPAGPIPLRTRT